MKKRGGRKEERDEDRFIEQVAELFKNENSGCRLVEASYAIDVLERTAALLPQKPPKVTRENTEVRKRIRYKDHETSTKLRQL